MFRVAVLASIAVAALSASAAAEYDSVRGAERHCHVVERIDAEREIVPVRPLSFREREDAERQARVLCRNGENERDAAGLDERKEERRAAPDLERGY
jgi:hypothetical protein